MDNNFRSGFVAIIGRPNVGKSTLMNHLIGQKIAITSNKPQTTRNKIQTVYTCDEGQIVFLDTPGIHKAKNKLGEYMVQVAERTLKEVDAIMWLVEPSTFVGAGERHIAEQLQKVGVPVILIINKIDTVKKKSFFLRSIPTVRSVILQRSFLALPSAEKTHRISFQVFSNIFRTDRCSMMKILLPTSLSARSPQRLSVRRLCMHWMRRSLTESPLPSTG